jgi:hypothetical protein
MVVAMCVLIPGLGAQGNLTPLWHAPASGTDKLR